MAKFKVGDPVRDKKFDPLVELKHMPATPMTQEEMQKQCNLASKAAEWDPGEENDS